MIVSACTTKKDNTKPNETNNIGNSIQVQKNKTSRDTKIPAKGKKRMFSLSDIDVDKLTNKELWDNYKSSRVEAEKFKDDGNFEQSITKLLLGAKCAKKLERPDIVSWQMNNAAKHCIDMYKDLTDYDNAMKKLMRMKYGDEKNIFRAKIQATCKENKLPLDMGLSYLKDASKYNRRKPDRNRASVIASNKQFINEMLAFIDLSGDF